MLRMARQLVLALTVALVGALPGLLPTDAALAQVGPGVKDQSQELHNLWGRIGGPEYRWGQVFTAGKTGTLYQVSLLLSKDTVSVTDEVPIKISIETVTAAGLPSGTQIGFGRIPLTAIPSVEAPDWVEVGISYTPVTAGTRYALLVATTGGWIRWYASNPGPYSPGHLVYRSTTTWETILGQDMTFKTYVFPPVLDQEQTYTDGTQAGGLYPVTVYHGREVGQVFTARKSGVLDRVGVKLSAYSYWGVDGVTRVTIQTLTPAGLPSGVVLGGGTIPPDVIPDMCCPDWREVRISDVLRPVTLTDGTRYALVLSRPDTHYLLIWWDAHDSDHYAAGYEVENNANAGWQVRPNYDTTFRTWVTLMVAGAQPPGPGPTTPPRNASQDCTQRVEPAVEGFLAPLFAPGTYDLSHGACVAAVTSHDVTPLAVDLCREPRVRTHIVEVLGLRGPLNQTQCVQRLKPYLERLLKDVLGP